METIQQEAIGPGSRPLRWHFIDTARLAWPVVLSQLSHVSVQLFDTIFVGRTNSANALGAISLAGSIFVVALVAGIGLSMGLTPLVAQARGRDERDYSPKLVFHAFILNLGVGLLFCAALLASVTFLDDLHQPESVIVLAKPVMTVLAYSIIPVMIFQTFRQYVEGMGNPGSAMVISVAANVINVALNYVFVLGKFGFEAAGALGSARATLFARCLMALAMGGYFLYAYGRHLPSLWERIEFDRLRELLKLGAPIALQLSFEVGAFSLAAIMIGWFGEVALAAHQIAISIASFTYMGASGVASAATVRVGFYLGARDGAGMRKSIQSSYLLGLGYMGAAAVLLFVFQTQLPFVFTREPEVASLATTLLFFAAIFQLSDGAQVVGLGVLRGMQDVLIPTLIAMGAYWVIAMPLSYYLAVSHGGQASGVWIALCVGLFLAAILLYVRSRVILNKLTGTLAGSFEKVDSVHNNV